MGFFQTTFSHKVNFEGTTFAKKRTFFTGARFSQGATFSGARFPGDAHFDAAVFSQGADFRNTRFCSLCTFAEATFSTGADFVGTRFTGERVNFRSSHFRGRTLFTSRQENGQNAPIPIFSEAEEVDFRQVVIDQPNAVIFREVDLNRCRFLDMDLRKVQLNGVTWPKKQGRFRVYDDPEVWEWLFAQKRP